MADGTKSDILARFVWPAIVAAGASLFGGYSGADSAGVTARVQQVEYRVAGIENKLDVLILRANGWPELKPPEPTVKYVPPDAVK